MQTILIAGASRGLGLEFARQDVAAWKAATLLQRDGTPCASW